MRTTTLFGLFAAGIGIILWLVAGIAGVQYYVAEEQIYVTLPFALWFLILALRSRKIELTGDISYIECLKTTLIFGASAGLLLSVFNFAYYTLAAQGVVEALARRAVDSAPASSRFSPIQREDIIVQAKWLAIIDSSIADLLTLFLASLFFGAVSGFFIRTKMNRGTEITQL